MARVERNSCRKAFQEVVKRQTAKEEHSILSTKAATAARKHQAYCKGRASEAEQGCRPRAALRSPTRSLRV